jgi:hypothetical protein
VKIIPANIKESTPGCSVISPRMPQNGILEEVSFQEIVPQPAFDFESNEKGNNICYFFFAIHADDTTNILILFVSKLSQIKERFLGFFDVSEDRTADALLLQMFWRHMNLRAN